MIKYAVRQHKRRKWIMSGEHFIVCISESVLYSGVLCRGVVNPDQFFSGQRASASASCGAVNAMGSRDTTVGQNGTGT